MLRAKILYLRSDPLDQNQSQTPDQCDSHWISQKRTTYSLLKECGEQQSPKAEERDTDCLEPQAAASDSDHLTPLGMHGLSGLSAQHMPNATTPPLGQSRGNSTGRQTGKIYLVQ